MTKSKKAIEKINIAGFFRLNIIEDDHGKAKVVGDSGWCKNMITNLGFQHYILETIAGISGSSQVSYFAVGTGTAPSETATSLDGELTDSETCRFTMTPSAVSSHFLQMVGVSETGITTDNRIIQNIGIFGVSSVTAGSILCGNTYATSQLQTNQGVSLSYFLQFSST